MRFLFPILSFALGWLCAYQPEPPRVYLADLVVDGHAVWCFSPGLSIERGFETAAFDGFDGALSPSDKRQPVCAAVWEPCGMTAHGFAESRLGQATGKKDKRQ